MGCHSFGHYRVSAMFSGLGTCWLGPGSLGFDSSRRKSTILSFSRKHPARALLKQLLVATCGSGCSSQAWEGG